MRERVQRRGTTTTLYYLIVVPTFSAFALLFLFSRRSSGCKNQARYHTDTWATRCCLFCLFVCLFVGWTRKYAPTQERLFAFFWGPGSIDFLLKHIPIVWCLDALTLFPGQRHGRSLGVGSFCRVHWRTNGALRLLTCGLCHGIIIVRWSKKGGDQGELRSSQQHDVN